MSVQVTVNGVPLSFIFVAAAKHVTCSIGSFDSFVSERKYLACRLDRENERHERQQFLATKKSQQQRASGDFMFHVRTT
jgi:hypothetical protein